MWWKLYVAVFYFYSCVGFCFGDGETQLKILVKPTLYNTGERKGIYCKVTNPRHAIEWQSNNGTIVEKRSSKNNRIFVEKEQEEDGDLAALIIMSTQLTDSGNWTCSSGDLSETITVLVGEKVNIPVRYEPLDGEEGKLIRLNCLAKGYPEPKVDWYKDGVLLSQSDDPKYTFSRRDDNYQLEIHNLNHMDTGEYVCKVTQEQLSHYTDKTMRLDVKHKPVIIHPDTNEIKLDKYLVIEAYAILNETKNLTCKVISNPSPTYKWLRKRRGFSTTLISDEDTVLISEDEAYSVLMLKMYNKSYFGEYECVANNSRGSVTQVFHVRPGNRPEPPDYAQWIKANSSVMWFNVTCTDCLLEVDPLKKDPKNLPIVEYQFQLATVTEEYPEPDWNNTFEISIPILVSNDTIFEVGPLPNSTKFKVRVRSRNDAGYSVWYLIDNDEIATTDFAVKMLSSIFLIILSVIMTHFHFR